MQVKDPLPVDGETMLLPDAWPDRMTLKNPLHFFRFLRHVLGGRRPVKLPDNSGLFDHLPSYLLQEFHHIPNGNFSNTLTKGYARTFDWSMLGMTHGMRREAAAIINGAKSALDVGCGSGSLADVFQRSGIRDVWGLDASPYLLRQGALRYPQVKFVPGLAEDMPFADERFEAVGACFVFHELPAKIADLVLKEIFRVLKPGARLVIIEPSPEQMQIKNWWSLFRLAGLKAIYFHVMARFVYEPFVAEWHARDPMKWFDSCGFKLIKDDMQVPFRFLIAEKMA